MASTPPAGPPRSHAVQRGLNALGAALLAAWSAWILASVLSPQFRLLGGSRVWFPASPFYPGAPWPYFGLDLLHNLAGAVTWAHEAEPYRALEFSYAEPVYVYPPLPLRLFSWTALFGLEGAKAAVGLFMGLLTALGLVAGLAAARARVALGHTRLPASLVTALFLCSTPFLFSLERGNYDLLVLACILCAAPLLRGPSLGAELAAGALLAMAAWMKVYPGLLLLPLLALGRWRAAAAMGMSGFLLGLLDLPQVLAWQATLRALYGSFESWSFVHFAHSLTQTWAGLARWLHLPSPSGALRATLTGLFVVPSVGYVCWQVYRSPRRAELGLLLLCFCAAVATFVPKVSFDYNLVFLALALLIAWDRSLPGWLQALFALQLLWLQPFAVPGLPGAVTFLLKIAGAAAVGLVLVRRAREIATADPKTGVC
ncbi:MAG: glycosyltransferase 87 family protein [Myxococcales bacterium]